MKAKKELVQIIKQETSRPRFSKFKQAIAIALTTAFLGIAPMAKAATNNQQQRSPAKTLMLKPRLPTQEEMYNSYMQQGIEYSQREENREQAIEYFAKAITLDLNKSIMLNTDNMSPEAKTLFTNTLRAAQFSKMMAEEKEKSKEKGWFARNWYWVVPLGIAAAGGIEYAIGDPLHIFTKKKEEKPEEPQPTQVTINYDVYNASKKGVLTSFTKTYTAGSQVTLRISDIEGISNVDTTHIIVRKNSVNKRVGELVAFDKSSGAATFTAPSASEDYDVLLLEYLGPDGYGPMDRMIDLGGGKLERPRNSKWNRVDRDGETGPDQPILDTMSQLNNALDSGEIDLGDIVRVSSGENFGVGYHNGSVGYHSLTWAGINPDKCDALGLAYKLVFTDEVFELLTAVDDIAGDGTTGTLICDSQGNLNNKGIAYLCYIYAKDQATDNQVSSSAASLHSLGRVNANIGGVDVGFDGDSVSAGFKGEHAGVASEFSLVGGKLSAYTTANFSGERFNTSLSARLAPGEDYFASEVNASLGKKEDPVNVGVHGSYAVFSGDNSFGFIIRKKDTGLSFDRSNRGDSVMNSVAVQTSFELGENNHVALSGGVVDSKLGAVKASHLTLGANASLDGLLKGLNISAGIGRDAYGPINASTAYVGVAQRIGPGMLYFRMMKTDGRVANYVISFSLNKAF